MVSSLPFSSGKDRIPAHKALWLILVLLLLSPAILLRAQTSSPATDLHKHIQNMLNLIHKGEQTNLPSEQIGIFWVMLGSDYASDMNLDMAEKAYIKGLQLIKNASGTNKNYAIALDDLGLLYYFMGREQEATNCLNAAIEIRKNLGDRLGIARSYEARALTYLNKSKFKNAEKYATLAYEEMQASGGSDTSDVVSTLLTKAYSKCYTKKCPEALEDIERARAVVDASPRPDSFLKGEVLFAQGFSLWKSGNPEKGGEFMRQAIDIFQKNMADSSPTLIESRKKYQLCLTDAHHDVEARRVAEQIASSTRNQPQQACPNCTVSIYGMANGWR